MANNNLEMLRRWWETVPNDRLAHLVRDTARSFARVLQIRLAKESIPLGHWTFLRILWAENGLTQKELSDRAGVMEPTTNGAMKSMEALGHIERRRLGDNQKNLYVYLTPEGRALETRLVPLAEAINEIASRGISDEHLAITRKTLLIMLENLGKEEECANTGAEGRKRPKASGARGDDREPKSRKFERSGVSVKVHRASTGSTET